MVSGYRCDPNETKNLRWKLAQDSIWASCYPRLRGFLASTSARRNVSFRLPSGYLTDEIHFLLFIRLAVLGKDLVEPFGGLTVGIGVLP